MYHKKKINKKKKRNPIDHVLDTLEDIQRVAKQGTGFQVAVMLHNQKPVSAF